MERAAEGIRFGQDRPSLLSTVGACGCLSAHVASGADRVRRTQGPGLEVASGGWRDDQSPAGRRKDGKNPTDRGKLGTKRSLLVDEQGVPLGIVVSGANTPDGRLLEATLHAVPIERPDPATTEQHLCLDKGYSGEPCARVAEDAGYIVHVPDKANAKKNVSASPVGARPVGG